MSEAKVIDVEDLGSQNFIDEVDPGLKVGTRARLSVFERQKAYSNGWTEPGLDLIESWLLKSVEGAKAHTKAAVLCRFKHRALSVPSILVGTVATAMAFFAAGDECSVTSSGPSAALKYTTAIFTSAITALGAISELYSFNQLMSLHIAHAGMYTDLSQEIETAIFIPNELKKNIEVVLTQISGKFSHITRTAPLL